MDARETLAAEALERGHGPAAKDTPMTQTPADELPPLPIPRNYQHDKGRSVAAAEAAQAQQGEDRMTAYRVTILHDACTTHDVKADSEAEAIEAAMDDSHVSLCHQCSNYLELGDPIRAACVEDLETGESNQDAALSQGVVPLTAPDNCPTHKTSSGDHTVCRRCRETWPSGSDRACVRAVDLVQRIGITGDKQHW